MFMRFVYHHINVDRIIEYRHMYTEVILRELERTEGCLYAGLLQSVERRENGVSLTLWNSAADAARYEQSGAFQRLLDEARPFFPEARDYTVHLSEDLHLEYVPVDHEPVVETFVDPSAPDGTPFAPPAGVRGMFIRFVALHLRPGMLGEFTSLYKSEIMPALRRTEGCRHAHLSGRSDDPLELISVTVWNSRNDAAQYEASGEFRALTEKVKHTLSGVASLRETGRGISLVSDELSVTGYILIVGKALGGPSP